MECDPCKEIEVTIDYEMSLYKHDNKSNGELGLKRVQLGTCVIQCLHYYYYYIFITIIILMCNF